MHCKFLWKQVNSSSEAQKDQAAILYGTNMKLPHYPSSFEPDPAVPSYRKQRSLEIESRHAEDTVS